MSRLATLLLALGLLASVPGGEARAQTLEEITSYDVLVEVQDDASLVVTEEIVAMESPEATGFGLVWSFQTSFPRRGWLARKEIPFRLLGVERNGELERYDMRTVGGEIGRAGIRMYVGWQRPPGRHRYVIRYETERHVSYGPLNDTLSWTAVRPGWTAPIDAVSLRVVWEGMVGVPELSGTVGVPGGARTPVEAAWDPAGTARFTTPRALAPGETFEVRIVVPKWIFRTPSHYRETQWFRLDWSGWVDAGWLCLLVAALYGVLWYRVGVDRGDRAIVVQYDPPAGYSAAEVGYLNDRGYRVRHFVAAVVSLTVKGAVELRRDGDAWRVRRRAGSGSGLGDDEHAVLEGLLGDDRELPLGRGEHARVTRAANALRWKLAARFERDYFVANARWFLAGMALSLVGFAWLVWRWRFPVPVGAWVLGVVLVLWTALVVSAAARVWSFVRHTRVGLGPKGGLITWGFLGALLVLVIVEVSLLSGFAEMVPTHMVVAALLMGVTNVTFYHLLQRPTLRGRGVLDHVEGFRDFLSAVERDRFQRLAGDPGAFERYLPHAIALGAAGRWAATFRDAPGPSPAETSEPPWRQDAGEELGDALRRALEGADG